MSTTLVKTLLLVGMTSVIQGSVAVERTASGDAPTEEATLLRALSQMIKDERKGFRNCPPPYTHILGECFYIHMYIPLVSWSDANTFCQQAGGILAEPKHFGAVAAHIFNTGMAEKIFRGIFNRVWLGGQRVGNTTSFEWSSGRPIEDNVVEDYDSYFSDPAGDCIMLRIFKDEPIHLRANSCDTKTHYICQLP